MQNMSSLAVLERKFNCNLNLVWTINSFAEAMQTTGKSFSAAVQTGKCFKQCELKSPTFRLWFGQTWQIQLRFEDDLLHENVLKVKLTNLSQETPEPHALKGTYTFFVALMSPLYDKEELHQSYKIESNIFFFDDSVPWSKFKYLRVWLKAEFCAFENTPGCETLCFNLGEKLLANKETEPFFDCRILVAGQELKANKAVLALASPVFSAMFTHDCKEKQTQSVQIEDTDVDTVEKFLHFAYTGQSPKFVSIKNTIKLFNMAEKYQVTILEKECMAHIESAIPDEKARDEIMALLRFAV